MSEPNPDQASQETARLVLQMDAAISAFRAEQLSGVQALDAASQIVRDPSIDLTIENMPGTYLALSNVVYRVDRIEWNSPSSRCSPIPTAPRC